MALTKKQKRFVEEYLIDLNATQAAVRAGYSANTAAEIGCENLTKPNIKQAVAEQMAERSRRTGISQDRVVQELARIAFVNITDIVDTGTGELRLDASADDLACIESIKYRQTESRSGSGIEREVKLSPKLRALELLGKHLGIFNEKIEVNGTISTNPFEGMTTEQLMKLVGDEDERY